MVGIKDTELTVAIEATDRAPNVALSEQLGRTAYGMLPIERPGFLRVRTVPRGVSTAMGLRRSSMGRAK